jgi:hypothetical protein
MAERLREEIWVETIIETERELRRFDSVRLEKEWHNNGRVRERGVYMDLQNNALSFKEKSLLY